MKKKGDEKDEYRETVKFSRKAAMNEINVNELRKRCEREMDEAEKKEADESVTTSLIKRRQTVYPSSLFSNSKIE